MVVYVQLTSKTICRSRHSRLLFGFLFLAISSRFCSAACRPDLHRYVASRERETQRREEAQPLTLPFITTLRPLLSLLVLSQPSPNSPAMRSSTTLLRFIALLVLCFTLASAAAEEGAGVEEDGQHVFRSRDNSRARAHNEPRRCKKMQRDTHDSGRRDGTDSHNFAISPQVLVQDDGPTPKVKNLAAAAASPSASPSAGAGGGAGAAGAAGNVSASCQQAIGQALSSDLAMCMGFDVLTSDPELAPLLNPTTAGSNQSLIGPLGKYLSQVSRRSAATWTEP